MSTSVTELVGQLADVKLRNDAWRQLLKLGPESAPTLLDAATRATPPQYRAILDILSELKDPRAEGLFRQALASDDPETRAIGARGLYRLNTPDAMDALRLAFNDAPDPLHFEHTLAVRSLIESGMAALPTVFLLMESAEAPTRERAQYALAAIVLRDITQQLQPRPLTSDALSAWEKLQQQNGSYRWDAPEPARRASVDLWKQWLQDQPGHSGNQ
jgi:HEAT repeat protein